MSNIKNAINKQQSCICLGKDTPVIMFDGSIKQVQNILVGDLLMGDNSKPKTVAKVTTENKQMYKINPIKGYEYIADESQVLALKLSKNASEYWDNSKKCYCVE